MLLNFSNLNISIVGTHNKQQQTRQNDWNSLGKNGIKFASCAAASSFHLCLLGEVWLELWATGPLDLWGLCFCALARERASCFAQPCPTSSHNPLPPAQHPRRAFKCSLKRGNAEGEVEIRACSSRRSIAWHYPPAIPSAPLSCSLLCSWCVSLNLFFSISFIP